MDYLAFIESIEGPALKRLVGTDVLSKHFNKSEKTVREWCAKGILPAVRLGSSWYVLEDELDEQIEQGASR